MTLPDGTSTDGTPSDHPFSDLADFTALPRVSGLTLSPDGARLVTTVATLKDDATGHVTALWEVDPAGERPARRLTRGLEGEAGAAFAADGTLYFTSTRPAPGGEEKTSTLWALPERGEARAVLSRPFGISSIHCAAAADAVVLGAPRLRGARTEAEHAALAKTRTDAGVDAILHSGYPVRFWDHDLGPAAPGTFEQVQGTITATRDTSGVGDRNTVNVDQEMLNLSKNEIMYEAAVTMLNKKLSMIKYAASGGS